MVERSSVRSSGPVNDFVRRLDGATDNLLLARLPPDEQLRIGAIGRLIDAPRTATLHTQGQRVESVHFPIDAMTSTIVTLASGEAVEVGLGGADGFVGISVLLGEPLANSTTIVQIPGRIFTIPVDAFVAHLADRRNILRPILLRYVNAFFGVVAQVAACNALHTVDERLARWLLMTRNRMGDSFDLTQDFLALMLGVRRPSVTGAAEALRRAGAITYVRGHITILDPARLAATSCACYVAIEGLIETALHPGDERR